jgi:hypothetical protein
LEDSDLIRWRKNGREHVHKYKAAVYEKYRLYPSDLGSDFDWSVVEEELEHKNQRKLAVDGSEHFD